MSAQYDPYSDPWWWQRRRGWSGTEIESDVYGAPIAPYWLGFCLFICICLAVAAPGAYVFFHGGMNSFTPTWLRIAAALLQLLSVAAGLVMFMLLTMVVFTMSEYRTAWRGYFRYRDQRGLALARRLAILNLAAAEQCLTSQEKARLIRESAGAEPGEKVFYYLPPEARLSSVERADGVIFCSHYLYNAWSIFPEAGNERREGFQIRIFSLSKQHEVSSQALLDQVISRSLLDQIFNERCPVTEVEAAMPTSVDREDIASLLFLMSIDRLHHSDAPEVLNRLIRIITEGEEVRRDVPSWEREDFGILKRQWKKWKKWR